MSGIKGVEIHRATTGASAYSDSSYAEYDQGGAYYRFTIVETV